MILMGDRSTSGMRLYLRKPCLSPNTIRRKLVYILSKYCPILNSYSNIIIIFLPKLPLTWSLRQHGILRLKTSDNMPGSKTKSELPQVGVQFHSDVKSGCPKDSGGGQEKYKEEHHI